MYFLNDTEFKPVFDAISSAGKTLGYDVYLVGGYVRDMFLNRPTKDIDVVCVGSGIKLAKAVAAFLDPTPRVTVYQRFGTAMFIHDNNNIEFVGARRESYDRSSRKPFVEDGTLREDQLRRDFTINALAISLNEDDYGQITDPFNGMEDLEARVIKTPVDPGRTFSDDPLRMLRAIRFATQLDFEIADETFDSIKEQAHRIEIISGERINAELEKIILSPEPSYGFDLLFQSGLLKLIFPELHDMQGVDKIRGIGHKDNFYHTLKVLDNLSMTTENYWLRWAAILHDIGKPPTKRFDPPNGWTFHAHEVVGARMAQTIFKRLKLPLGPQLKYVQKLIQLHQRPVSLAMETVSDSAVRRLVYDAGEDIDDLLLLCQADITSKNEKKVRQYLKNYEVLREKIKEVEEKDRLRNWQPPISGQVIMESFNLKPCREVGLIKDAIREAILEGEIPNEYEAAFALMIEEGNKLGLKKIE
jgi:putative nucleotidyltransferase with HDIG domain